MVELLEFEGYDDHVNLLVNSFKGALSSVPMYFAASYGGVRRLVLFANISNSKKHQTTATLYPRPDRQSFMAYWISF
jgi:hypothetical protein